MTRKVYGGEGLDRQHDGIPVNGIVHCIRGPEDLTRPMRLRLSQLSKERDRLVNDDAPAEEQEALLTEMLNLVFIREPEQYDDLLSGDHVHDGPTDDEFANVPTWLMEEWFDFFMSRSETAAEALLNRAARRATSQMSKSRQPAEPTMAETH